MAGKNHLNYKRKCWPNTEGPLVGSLLWGIYLVLGAKRITWYHVPCHVTLSEDCAQCAVKANLACNLSVVTSKTFQTTQTFVYQAQQISHLFFIKNNFKVVSVGLDTRQLIIVSLFIEEHVKLSIPPRLWSCVCFYMRVCDTVSYIFTFVIVYIFFSSVEMGNIEHRG